MINRNKNTRQKVDTKGMSVLSIDDTQDFRFAILSALGKAQKCQAFSPYGLCTNPPDESLAIAFNIQGIGSNTVAIIDDPKNRKKGLLKGEVAIVNYLTGAFIYLKEDGSVDIENPSGSKIKMLPDGTVEITASNTKINGDLEVTGDIKTATVPSYIAHTHIGVTTGPSNTGGPS